MDAIRSDLSLLPVDVEPGTIGLGSMIGRSPEWRVMLSAVRVYPRHLVFYVSAFSRTRRTPEQARALMRAASEARIRPERSAPEALMTDVFTSEPETESGVSLLSGQLMACAHTQVCHALFLLSVDEGWQDLRVAARWPAEGVVGSPLALSASTLADAAGRAHAVW